MAHDDAAIIERWRRGDPAGFEGLVRRWQTPIARFLGRMAANRESVEDLCQEVFLRVYAARDRYQPTAEFATWLYRIALNVARDAGRRRKHELRPLPNGELIQEQPTVAAACERKEAAEMVAQALAELPIPLREVLVLRHYEGMNFEAIARLTGTPASTLKSRFSAALLKMREKLQGLK